MSANITSTVTLCWHCSVRALGVPFTMLVSQCPYQLLHQCSLFQRISSFYQRTSAMVDPLLLVVFLQCFWYFIHWSLFTNIVFILQEPSSMTSFMHPLWWPNFGLRWKLRWLTLMANYGIWQSLRWKLRWPFLTTKFWPQQSLWWQLWCLIPTTNFELRQSFWWQLWLPILGFDNHFNENFVDQLILRSDNHSKNNSDNHFDDTSSDCHWVANFKDQLLAPILFIFDDKLW